jgi:fructose-1,6-bisphosphatase/inositol monophosphatase family enzyme
MHDRLQLAIQIAREAGAIMRDSFGKNHNVELKSDLSPVTSIDKEINALVVKTLTKRYPDDGLLGEEENSGTGSERYQWICDPLDGTKPFILGLRNSVFMLALSENGIILLSVVYDPYADEMYYAIRGEGSFCNGKRLHVSQDPVNEGYALVGSDSFRYAAALKRITRGIEPVPGTGFQMHDDRQRTWHRDGQRLCRLP